MLSDYHNTMMGLGDAVEDDTASAGCVGDPRAIIGNCSVVGSFCCLPLC